MPPISHAEICAHGHNVAFKFKTLEALNIFNVLLIQNSYRLRHFYFFKFTFAPTSTMFFRSFVATSRKNLWFVLLSLMMVNVVIFSYFQILAPINEIKTVASHFADPTDFHAAAFKLFSKVESETSRFWLADSSLSHLTAQVSPESVFAPDGQEPQGFYFDPRLTLAAYFEELRKLGSLEVPHTLPFHWSDWVDLSVLNEQYLASPVMQMTCDRIRRKVRGRPNTDYFCRSRDAITDDEVHQLGYKSRTNLPPGLVFGHCTHDHASFNDHRVYLGRAYLLAYLPKPYKVIVLSKDRGTYEFNVDQSKNPEQRMVNNGMIDRYTQKYLKQPAASLLDLKTPFEVDHLKVYKKLQKEITPTIMPDSEDELHMRAVVNSPPDTAKDINLTDLHFDYPPEMILNQIKEYQAMTNRSVFEENFYQGLLECSKYNSQNEPVYFKMATLNVQERKNSKKDFGWHYDWRFFNDALFYEKPGWTAQERIVRSQIILERLLRNWNRFAEEKGIVTWIMHGPLLSWYWDGLMFPFDIDIDIQMPISELVRLSKNYNQTLVVEDPTEGYGRFLIDVGSYIHNRDIAKSNYIDARFVDVDTGIYIDITAIAKSGANLPEEYKKNPIVVKPENDRSAQVYNDRRKHFYTLDQLLPLHYTRLSGVPVFAPSNIEQRMRFLYSKGLTDYEYNGWYFVPKLQLWIMTDKLLKVLPGHLIMRDHEPNREMMIQAARDISDEHALGLLEDDETLLEYYLTSKYTDWHLQEKQILFDEFGSDNPSALDNPEIRARHNRLTGQISFDKPMRKCLFEYETYDRAAHEEQAAESPGTSPLPPLFR